MAFMLGNIVKRMFGIKTEMPDFLDRKRRSRKWVMKIALKYLRPDIYMFFIEHYTSKRIDDNRAARPIEEYIIRRYKYEQSQRDMERNKFDLHRRRQINERSKD